MNIVYIVHYTGCGTETGDCENHSRLDECLRKGGGHLEDVVFKK